MAGPRGQNTRRRIQEAARKQIAERGVAGFTLEAVARDVGVTKQAVLYHFGSRGGLVAEAFLDLLADESGALVEAVGDAEPGPEAIRSFLRGAVAWHLEDPDRFRLLYAAVQMGHVDEQLDEETLRERVYPVTGRVYEVLEAKLRPVVADAVQARRLGVALHMLVIGIAAYQGMLAASDETFRHDWHDVTDTLVDVLTRGMV